MENIIIDGANVTVTETQAVTKFSGTIEDIDAEILGHEANITQAQTRVQELRDLKERILAEMK